MFLCINYSLFTFHYSLNFERPIARTTGLSVSFTSKLRVRGYLLTIL